LVIEVEYPSRKVAAQIWRARVGRVALYLFHDFLALGRKDPSDDAEPFCMTALALRLAQSSNGVSPLHGQVTRRLDLITPFLSGLTVWAQADASSGDNSTP
jgi:glucan phosphorylase